MFERSKHTAGPWVVSLGGCYVRYEGVHGFNICDLTVFGGPPDEGEANARLMAAAPQMFEALLGARRLIQTLLDTSVVHKQPESYSQQVKPEGWAEIAKTRMPDWACRQLLSECDEALAKALGKENANAEI